MTPGWPLALAGQRAITAAKAPPMFEEAARQRQRAGKRLSRDSAEGRGRQSCDDTAAKFKVSTNSADHRQSRDDAAKFKVGVNQVQRAIVAARALEHMPERRGGD